MRFLTASFSLLAVLLAPMNAQAHFVWVAVHQDGEQRVARIYFGESAAPGEARLIGRIAQTRLWSRSLIKPTTKLKTKSIVNGERAWLEAAMSPASPSVLEADCLYGVFSRGDKPILLHYYAKSLNAAAANLRKLGRATKLGLDIVPSITPDGLQLKVLHEGDPAAGCEVVVMSPAGAKTQVETDDDGVVWIKSLVGGRYAIRARVAESKAGSYQGEQYENIRHYCTLTLDIPPSLADASEKVSAADLLFKARQARAIWSEFPGFTADVCVNIDGRARCGKINVDADGKVTLKGVKLDEESAAVRSLQSLISHRLGSAEFTEDVSYADQQTGHPLGRLIKLDYDSRMASTYRVKGDVISQVNREMGGGRFTISVFRVHRNKENKVLPEFYNVCFWNKDGALRSSTTAHDEWTRVGAFDLPTSHTFVTGGEGSYSSVWIGFSNHRLTDRLTE